MSVKKRKDGRWQVYVVGRIDGARVRFRQAAPTRAAGNALELDFKAKLGKGAAPIVGALRFTEWAREFLEVYPEANNAPSEVDAKKRIVRLHLQPFFGDKALDRICVGDVERFKAEQKKAGAKPKTINNRLTVLRRMLTVAVEWGRCAAAPKVSLMKKEPQKHRFLDFDESKRLIAAVTPLDWWRTMVLVGLRTGLRRGELLALRWEDVDLAGSLLNVQRSVWKGQEKAPKSGKARKVPLSVDAREALRLLPSRFLKGYVFGDGKTRLTTGELQSPMITASKRAELARVGWHVLRHTFASQLVMKGVSLRVVQEWMGHSTITMTERYAHLAPGFSSDAVSMLDEVKAVG